MTDLELFAPARNADIGIAAIDCGADAVYIAGPEFGARQDAGNPMEDVRRLCEYAHKFGVRIFLTLNTILYDSELPAANRILEEAREAGVDAVIAQDLAVFAALSPAPVLRQAQQPVEGPAVHASTQCAIRTPEQARFYESLGATRLVLERQLSLDQIRAIREAVSCELEFFVHGALCVCYSGNCYMSEAIAGRSANRGACVQACRSLYDLRDRTGKTLVKNKALLSLKDYNLIGRLSDLAEAGICSFKIEGRLKNISYVRNVVRAYSLALDELVSRNPGKYRRASFGRVEGGFTPDLGKTFNRGYTELFIDGKRGKWSSMDAPKSIGEPVGTVVRINCGDPRAKGLVSPKPTSRMQVFLNLREPFRQLRNSDGFSFISKDHNGIIGFRGNVCRGAMIEARAVPELYEGAELYRNLDTAFEKEMEANLPERRIPVEVRIAVNSRFAGTPSEPGEVHPRFAAAEYRLSPEALPATNDSQHRSSAAEHNLSPEALPAKNVPAYTIAIKAKSEDGRTVEFELDGGNEAAANAERMEAMFRTQIGKAAGIYSFSMASLEVRTSDGSLPFLSAATLNGIRREVAQRLDGMPVQMVTTVPEPGEGVEPQALRQAQGPCQTVTYKANIANKVARETLSRLGAETIEDAFELSHKKEAELMRSKYCVRHELGLCSRHQVGTVPVVRQAHQPVEGVEAPGPDGPKDLFLVNNGKRYRLGFDCAACEMTVSYSE